MPCLMIYSIVHWRHNGRRGYWAGTQEYKVRAAIRKKDGVEEGLKKKERGFIKSKFRADITWIIEVWVNCLA